jgi:hypothetical protein
LSQEARERRYRRSGRCDLKGFVEALAGWMSMEREMIEAVTDTTGIMLWRKGRGPGDLKG